MVGNRHRWIVVAVVLLAAGCGSDAAQDQREPLSGTVHGEAFTVRGAIAMEKDGKRYLTLSSDMADCATGTSPRPGLVVVNVTVPAAALVPGTYALGSSDPTPRVAVTTFAANPEGGLRQTSDVVSSGKLHVHESAGGGLSGRLEIGDGVAALSGAFSAEGCAR